VSARALGHQVLAAEVAQHVTPDDVFMLAAEKARRDFSFFFRNFAWPALNPGVRYRHNWHVDAIAEHLTAIHTGQIKRLIINMPFRMLKTTLCSVAFPAWEWIDRPELHFLTSSYAINLSTRDAVDSRRIIESQAYQRAYGHRFRMADDQNQKTRYENDRRGQRVVTSTDSAGTGFGGNRIIIDDPISAREATSEPALKSSVDWWKGTGVTRLNDPMNDAILLVHQRLAQEDLSGYILLNEPEKWDHLVLPMRYEREHTKTTSIGWKDPRTRDGELLHPDRLDDGAVTSLEKTMGDYHAQAQLQQRPDKSGGLQFKVEKLKFVAAAPNGVRWVRGWDFAGTEDAKKGKAESTQAYTAAVKVGYDPNTKEWYVGHSWRERIDAGVLVDNIKLMTKSDGTGVEVDFPQDPGQAGKQQAIYIAKELAGYPVSYSTETGDKATRATPFSSQVNAGNVSLVIGDWNAAYVEELRGFPGAAIKDQVDASSRAFNKIIGIGSNTSMLDWVKGEVDKLAEAQEKRREQGVETELAQAGTNFAAFVAQRR
jgi:predicted phage terminase large subunit-like protein